MRKALPVLFLAVIMTVTINFPDGLMVTLVCAFFSLPFGALIVNLSEGDSREKETLWTLFILALAVRAVFGSIAYYADFWTYFASDARAYNEFGKILADHYSGLINITKENDPLLYHRFFSFSGPGWGMYHLIAFLYLFTDQNPVAGNFFCASISSGAVPIVYMLAREIYSNRRVALISSLLVGFMPGFINWSSFMLKDGMIMFFLALSILLVIRLQKEFKLLYVVLLLVSLVGIISLRFYIFPMLAVAILASFIVGVRTDDTAVSVFRRVFALVVLGTALTYIGALRSVSEDLQKYATLERVNISRLDLARSAASGFQEEADVSTVEGAVAVLPAGFVNLMFAPFPWQVTSLRAALTQPEMLVWWLMIPFLIKGLSYSIKRKLRETLAILIFSLMLTISYSIFQGNIGTAYRQRTQIQVFLFIFVAVGWVVTREKRENEALVRRLREIQTMGMIRGREN
ncbi:MAG: phospholipid carrier-dependent glycosyltransferase [Pyrinomonadaceae bacterium]|nr:phospholipid carrier-dependent glycosyltransferase [Pyrinomonadaceae bacterium]